MSLLCLVSSFSSSGHIFGFLTYFRFGRLPSLMGGGDETSEERPKPEEVGVAVASSRTYSIYSLLKAGIVTT